MAGARPVAAVRAELERAVALAGSGSAAGADIVLVLARAMENATPDQVLPVLQDLLGRAGLLPPGVLPWPVPGQMGSVQVTELPVPAVPSFGLVMSVRNHAHLVDRALDGLARQARPFDRIVLVDDASEDASLDRLLAFAAGQPNLTVLRNARPAGAVAAVNHALEGLGTDYLAWAAADDLLLPDALSSLAEAARAWPRAGLLLGETGVAELVDGRIGPVGSMGHGGARLGSLPPFLAPQALPRHLCCRRLAFGTAWLLRRDALEGIGRFDPAMGSLADFFALLAVLCRHGAGIVPERLSVMSVDRGSYSRRTGRDPARINGARDALLARLKGRGMEDVHALVLASPALILDLQAEVELFSGYLAARPWHWDLLVCGLWWALSHGAMSISRQG